MNIEELKKQAETEIADFIAQTMAELIKNNADEIKSEVMADYIHLGEMKGFTKEWNINGETVMLGVEKL